MNRPCETHEIREDMLIRQVPVYSEGGYIGIRNQIVITKEEFLSCYNAWVNDT